MKNHALDAIKKVFTFFVISLFPVFCFAQQSYIALSVGPAVPMGQYASTDISLNNLLAGNLNVAGFANTGFQANIDGAHYFDNHFGISFTGGYSQESYNSAPIEDLYESGFNSYGTSYFSPGVQVNSAPYRNLFLFVGPSVGIGNDKMYADFRFLMGIYSSSFNNLHLSYTSTDSSSGQGSDDTKFTAPASIQFGFLFGASLRYKLNDKVSFLFKLDLMVSKQSYNVTVTETDVSYNPYGYPSSQSQTAISNMTNESNVTVFSPSIGIALNLDKPVK